MKKRFFSILLSLCMVLMLLPVTAFAEEPESIDITLTGFEVGKTPADCTFTFTTTIPDVEFGADDIRGLGWVICEEDNGVIWEKRLMSETERFEADTLYKIDLLLQTNVFTSDPTVTMNGIIVSDAGVNKTGLLDIPYYLGKPALPTITISGADAVCAQQDYEFTITAPAGVTLDSEFGYDTGNMGGGWKMTIDEDGVGHGVMLAEWYDPNKDSFELIAHGWIAGGTPVSATKHVEVSPEHVYVDGVCGCGAQQEFTLSVPFTTTVELGGNTAPGETTFDLAIVDANAGEDSYADVTVSGSVTTDGAGDYTGTLTLTGPDDQLWNMLCEGAFVQQVNAGEEGWTYDDTVWGLLLDGGVALSTDDAAPEYTVVILPATCEETDNGVYYDLDWEADPLDEMSFTNIYTKSTTKPAESTKPTTNNTNTGVTTSVQTGDNSNLMLWLVLFAVSAIGAIGTGVYNKRRRNSRTK